jgi:hypothetical protein
MIDFMGFIAIVALWGGLCISLCIGGERNKKWWFVSACCASGLYTIGIFLFD